MPDHDKNIEKFVRKIIEIQHSKFEKKITDGDLESIAEELGLSPGEWRDLLKVYDNHIIRAKGFMQFSNWDDALKELEQALTIKPHNPDALYLAANCSVKLWHEKKDAKYKKEGQKYARTCVNIDPTHRDALQLLSNLKRSVHKSVNKTSIAIAVILVVIVILAFISLFRRPASESDISVISTEESEKSEASEKEEDSQTSRKEENTTEPVIADDESPEVEVEFVKNNKSSGIEFNTQTSVFNKYDASFSYNFRGDFISKSHEISALKIKYDLFDENNKLVISKLKKIIDEHSPVARNNDIIPVDFLVYEKVNHVPNIKRALITVHYIEKQAAPPKYETSKKLDFEWLSSRPPNYNIEVSERFSKYTTSFGNDAYCNIIFEVKNTGNVDINLLKLELQWFDANGKVLQSKDFYVNSTSNPKIKREQIRLKSGTWSIKNGKNNKNLRYKVLISEIN